MNQRDDQTGFNPKRRLCPDGTCTGVLAGDGRCAECGKAAQGSTAGGSGDGATQSAWLTALDNEPTADVNVAQDGAPVPSPVGSGISTLSAAGFDPARRLCDDGTCVGVIGAAGVCTVCGRPAA